MPNSPAFLPVCLMFDSSNAIAIFGSIQSFACVCRIGFFILASLFTKQLSAWRLWCCFLLWITCLLHSPFMSQKSDSPSVCCIPVHIGSFLLDVFLFYDYFAIPNFLKMIQNIDEIRINFYISIKKSWYTDTCGSPAYFGFILYFIKGKALFAHSPGASFG